MRAFVLIGTLLAAAPASARGWAVGRDPASYDSSTSSAHFDYHWDRSNVSQAEVAQVVSQAEERFGQISAFLGAEHTPKGRLELILDGDSFRPGAGEKPRFPCVDAKGRIYLYRFPGLDGFNELTHEMVHAFRAAEGVQRRHDDDYMTGFGFVEEGFAEFVSVQIEGAHVGFTHYGYAEEIGVGTWISRGQDIPPAVMMGRHDLNAKCIAQMYPLRSSFMRYLFATYGKDRLFQLAYSAGPVSSASYPALFGRTVEQLSADWKSWAVGRFAAIPGSNRLSHDYWEKTPISHFPVCVAGVDY